MANHYYLDENEYKLIIDKLSKCKTKESAELKKTLEYQFKKLHQQDKTYIYAATYNLAKNYYKLYENQDIYVDSDANISETENGAYVHCWVWVDRNLKNKNYRKQTK